MEKSIVDAVLSESVKDYLKAVENESNDLAGSLMGYIQGRDPKPSVESVIRACTSILVDTVRASERHGYIDRNAAFDILQNVVREYKSLSMKTDGKGGD